jgi:hypothetical protein
VASIDDRIDEYVGLTAGPGMTQPGFSLKRHATSELTGKVHVEQLAFMRDRSHRTHVMCARQCGKSQGCDGVLMDAGLFKPHSTNIILGLNGPHVRMQNWEPIWKRMFDRYGGIDPDWRNEQRMVTAFPNGARVIMSGTDDAKHLKNYLGGRIDNGVFIVDECFPAGTLVDGSPIETIRVGDAVSAVDHLSGRVVRRKVARVLEKKVSDLVRIAFTGGSVVCTPNHPVFAKGRGYVHAGSLGSGDMLCVRRSVSGPQDVLGAVSVDAPPSPVDGEPVAHAGGQRETVGDAPREQSDEQPGVKGEDAGDVVGDGSSAERPGWQREGADGSGIGAGGSAWSSLEDRGGGADEGEARVRLSDLLQAGLGGRIDQDVYRGRWSQPFDAGPEGAGREEDGALGWARVEGVSRVEPGSPGGTTVYNLEVEGAHTYFANGALVHNCQDQQNLDELLDSVLPPMMGMNARLILAGVFPDAPVGRFWRESGWVERDGQWLQEPSRGWSRHNWGRLANVHVPDSWEQLQRYLSDTGLTMNDQQIIRDWQGKPAFDPNVTAYRYDRLRNGYTAQMPDWLRMVYAQQKDDRGRDLKYAHEMRPDKDGVLHGMMAAEPIAGVRIFSLALDPGATSDAASIQGFGWGPDFRGAQHLFDWTTLRRSHVSTGDMFAVLGLAYKAFLRWGEALNPRYDAGSSQNTIDNLQNDYGLPLVLAAKKTDLIGQVNRFNDLMTEAKLKVMQGSAMEQDLMRARWNKAALERHQRDWDRSHHPNASESGRYALQDYFEAAVPKQTGPGAGYGYQDPIDKSRPAVSYNQITGTGEAYGGGNAFDPGGGNGSGGGGYGGAWNP